MELLGFSLATVSLRLLPRLPRLWTTLPTSTLATTTTWFQTFEFTPKRIIEASLYDFIASISSPDFRTRTGTSNLLLLSAILNILLTGLLLRLPT